MTRQNRIHKGLCEWEKERKAMKKDIQRYYPKGIRSYRTRKFWKQVNKDFDARWRKEHKNGNE